MGLMLQKSMMYCKLVQALMMNVQLRPLNSCDKFRCATGIELRPRLTEPPHYVVFRANVDGIITKIEMK